MNKVFVCIVFLSSILSGCASFDHTVDVKRIKPGQSAVVGKIKVVARHWISGHIVNIEEAALKDGSIAIKKCKSPDEIPEIYIGYAGVRRLLTNADGSILIPIESGKYCLVDVHAKMPGLGNYIHEEFSRKKGVKGTLVFKVLPAAINYIGDIVIIVDFESYEDKNKDGHIEATEFESSLIDFNSVSEGKPQFSAMTRWKGISILVEDKFAEVHMNGDAVKSMPDRVEF